MFKKCMKCGSVIYVVNGESSITCCGSEMKELVANSVDASFEKHVPNVEVKDDKIKVTVDHVMDKDHYIAWIALKSNNEIIIKKLEDKAEVTFDYIEGSIVYSYCNKHGLWSKEI